jgi:hypothetical protein
MPKVKRQGIPNLKGLPLAAGSRFGKEEPTVNSPDELTVMATTARSTCPLRCPLYFML